MNMIPLSKRVLQRAISPFLRNISQRRFAILHEITHSQDPDFLKFLSYTDKSPVLDATLTFDDGFHSSYQAIKQLQNRKAIFFVCPEFINLAGTSRWQIFFYNNLLRTEDLKDRELREAVRPASWEDLRELVAMGHTVGSHTMNHARLSKIISPKELEREIIGSVDMIEDKLQVKIDTFAYPFGNVESINERAYSIIKKRYKYCFTGIRGNNADSVNPYITWRDAIDLSWPSDYSEFVLKGGLDWYYWFKKRKLFSMAR